MLLLVSIDEDRGSWVGSAGAWRRGEEAIPRHFHHSSLTSTAGAPSPPTPRATSDIRSALPDITQRESPTERPLQAQKLRKSSEATIERMAADLWAVVTHLGIDRLVYVGHSMGSAIGWRFTADHPEVVVAGVSIAGIPVTGKLEESRPWVLGMIDMAGDTAALTEMIGGLYKHLDVVGADHLRSVGEAAAVVPQETIREIVTNQFHVDQRADALPHLTQPWLFIASSEDESEPAAHQTERAGLLPSATTVVLEGEGHMAPQESPALVADAILDFLSTHPAHGATRVASA